MNPPLSQQLSPRRPETRIEPEGPWPRLRLSELLQHRDLLLLLAWRDIRVRYKQTIAGASWAVMQPFLTMVVFTVFLGRVEGLKTEGVPYPLFAFSGLVPWTYLTHALTKCSNCLVDARSTVTRAYFPRLILPLASVLGASVDFLIAFAMLVVLMVWFGVSPTVVVLVLPLFMLLTVLTALGVGLWLAALNAEYRDVNNAIPFLTQLWLFLTPVAYSSKLIPESFRVLYGLNPMTGVVEGFRWALLGTVYPVPIGMLAVSSGAVLLILVSGGAYFLHKEGTLADVL